METGVSSKGEGIFTGMLMGTLLWGAIVVLGSILAQSNPPIPRPFVSGQDEQGLNTKEPDDRGHEDRESKQFSTALDQDNPKETSGPNENKRSEQEAEAWYERPTIADWIMATFTGLLLVCTFLQIWILFVELTHTQATVDEMRLDRRAWISYELPEVTSLVAGQPLAINLAIKNTGKTPGTITQDYAHPFVVPFGTEALGPDIAEFERKLAERPIGEHVVAPDMGHILATAHLAPTEPGAAGIAAGVLLLFVASGINYVDVTGKSRITRACFIYSPQTKSLWGYTKHNKMT